MILEHLIWFISVTYEEDIALKVLLYHEPRASTKTKPLSLADSIEPKSLMLSYLLACLYLTDITRILSKMSLDIITEIYIAKEADTLTVLAFCIKKLCLFCHLAYLMLPQMTYREHQFVHLNRVNLAEEVSLVLYWIRTSTEPHLIIYNGCSGIMACGNLVIVLTSHILEATKLNEFVAHYIRIRSKSLTSLVHSVANNLLPVFLVKVDDIKFQSVLTGKPLTDLHIFLRRTVPFSIPVRTNLYIKQMGINTLLLQHVNRNSRVYST